MTIGGVAGMLMTAPAGALIDATTRKRTYVIVPGICTVLASAIILLSQNFWLVAASQVATAIAGAAIGPAVAGITLGIVRQAGFNRQIGRNQAFNHAGNMVGAGLSGLLGWKFGLTAVFWLAALFGVLSIVSVLMIPRDAIDDSVARGMKEDGEDDGKASGFRVLLECKPLLVLAAALACFHLGNARDAAALRPGGRRREAGRSRELRRDDDRRRARRHDRRLAHRHADGREGGLLAGAADLLPRAADPRPDRRPSSSAAGASIPVQMLDGVGAGLQSVAVPGLVARILNGTGRVNVGQGAVMTVQGLGRFAQPRDRRLDRAGDRLWRRRS